jgi:hypothetical protein
MKNNKKFFITVISMILGSSVLLGSLISCIQGLDVLDGPGYTDGSDPADLVSLPLTPQEEMQKKFDKFNFFENKEDGTNVVRIYSHKDVDRFMQMRENGERQSLSYDEVLFLMKDSVRLYMEYDEIVLTDGFDIGMFDTDQTGSRVIKTDHREYSEDNVNYACKRRKAIIQDIWVIFVYRCFVYDTWILPKLERYVSFSGLYGGTAHYLDWEDVPKKDITSSDYYKYEYVYMKFYNEYLFNDYDEYVSAFDSAEIIFNTDGINAVPYKQIFPQPCLIIINGGFEVRYQNNAVETFYIEDFIETPEWLAEHIENSPRPVKTWTLRRNLYKNDHYHIEDVVAH